MVDINTIQLPKYTMLATGQYDIVGNYHTFRVCCHLTRCLCVLTVLVQAMVKEPFCFDDNGLFIDGFIYI